MNLFSNEDERAMQFASTQSAVSDLDDKVNILAIQIDKLQRVVTSLAKEVSKEPSKYEF